MDNAPPIVKPSVGAARRPHLRLCAVEDEATQERERAGSGISTSRPGSSRPVTRAAQEARDRGLRRELEKLAAMAPHCRILNPSEEVPAKQAVA